MCKYTKKYLAVGAGIFKTFLRLSFHKRSAQASAAF